MQLKHGAGEMVSLWMVREVVGWGCRGLFQNKPSFPVVTCSECWWGWGRGINRIFRIAVHPTEGQYQVPRIHVEHRCNTSMCPSL